MKKSKKAISITALLLVLAMLFSACSASGGGTSMAPSSPQSETAASGPAQRNEGQSLPASDSGPENNEQFAPAPSTSIQAAKPQIGQNQQYTEEVYSAADNGFNGEPFPPSDEEYLNIRENAEQDVSENPLLTFGLKVDTASYRNITRFIDDGALPPSDAVRIEEMINYFNYDEILTETYDIPFSVYTEIGPSPFDTSKEVAFVRVKSREIDRSQMPSSNLTFLIDTSGSMDTYDKLPLLKSAFSLLVENLTQDDKVSIVTYAGSAGVVLDSVSGNQKDKILKAIDKLNASGSTAGQKGINTAYDLAEKNFKAGANNRVILATDGDFNVGVSSVNDLERLISKKRESGVYLSILGFGTENLKDNRMETLAKNGNGNYSYIDSVQAAKKVLADELSANLFTIADDVKTQIEFNPAQVSSYRLIGYENRMLDNRDFDNDRVDSGEIGIGTDVVLMFEITRAEGETGLKYQQEDTDTPDYSDELFEVKIRYKDPGESESKLITHAVKALRYTDFNSADFNFAVSVAAFGHLLKNSPYTGAVSIERVRATALDSLGYDNGGYRSEFINLLDKYMRIVGR
ncbi:MAG: VWA domain-containing protein [Clostridiales bacterium]|jgi:Ca-activated chloride channel family protein|nr:VWA domain-containing protein [Clostridiales bacterium]